MLLTAYYINVLKAFNTMVNYFSWSSHQVLSHAVDILSVPLCPYLCLMLANALFRNVFIIQQYYGLLQRRSGKDIHSRSRWRRGIHSYRRKINKQPTGNLVPQVTGEWTFFPSRNSYGKDFLDFSTQCHIQLFYNVFYNSVCLHNLFMFNHA